MKCHKCKSDPRLDHLENCPNCGEKYSSTAKPKKSMAGLFWVALGIPAIFLLLLFSLGSEKKSGDPSASSSAAEKKCGSSGMAFVMAGNFVKKRLVAPSTAKFPYAHDEGVIVVPLEGCKFQILGHFDAQNSFGAMIRSRFTVTMESTEGGSSWLAHDLVIE